MPCISPETGASLIFEEAILGRRTTWRRLHFAVVTVNRKEPPDGIEWHWRCANIFGASFARRDRDAARAWLVRAIAAGHRDIVVAYRPRNGGTLFNVDRLGLRQDVVANVG